MTQQISFQTVFVAMTGFLFVPMPVSACRAQEAQIVVTSPAEWQVIQRTGFDPSAPKVQVASGSAEVMIRGVCPDEQSSLRQLEYRLLRSSHSLDVLRDWTPLNVTAANRHGLEFSSAVTVPAGGWYRLELRTLANSAGATVNGFVASFGVGEVFLVAGQSYATNTNDQRLSVDDPEGRVVALNTAKSSWAVANDPQPAPDRSDGGSIWPAVGDLLVKDLQVPVGFANVAVGGTSSAEWLPEGSLHAGLIDGGKQLGRFRAVLWQQGESDVIAKTSMEAYITNLKNIRSAAVTAWGFEPVWLAAMSTHHPTVYNDPEGEGRIRKAITELTSIPGFGAGPDTDTLTGENRGDVNSRRHFSAIGQQRAAAMWHATLMKRLKIAPQGADLN